ncbi:hypothetical protein [Streptomyces sp. NPDC001388]|uniref:hypothetical protein n=1 Tax=Streptomyces sp. NPDC001388 TaxID=3364568 RepID=UPI00368CDE23
MSWGSTSEANRLEERLAERRARKSTPHPEPTHGKRSEPEYEPSVVHQRPLESLATNATDDMSRPTGVSQALRSGNCSARQLSPAPPSSQGASSSGLSGVSVASPG